MSIKIGRHLPFLKENQLLGVVQLMVENDFEAGAFYVSESRSYGTFYELDDSLTEAGMRLAKENNIDLKNNIVIHAPLIGNMASCDPIKNIWDKTVSAYILDQKRMNYFGLLYYNFHPGSWVDKKKGIERCAEGINKVHKNSKDTILLLETMPKKGNYIGTTFKELSEIIDLVDDKSRIGVCIDTCHIWDEGYDLSKPREVIDEFTKNLDISFLKAIHVNDSKNELGSRKDRHENIGEGFIGLETLRNFLHQPEIKNLPLSLETPYDSKNFDWDKLKAEVNKLR